MALYAYTTIDIDLSPIRIYHYDLMILIQFNTAVPIWSVSSAPLRCVKISLPGWCAQLMIIMHHFMSLPFGQVAYCSYPANIVNSEKNILVAS